MENYNALYLSPMIPSFNLDETFRFFKEILEFTPIMDSESYAILQKNKLTVHILPAGHDIGQMEFYLEIDDVDQLWSSIKDRITGIKVREPFNREYGMREIHIEIPATKTLLFIGQEMASFNK
jgi:hypothetical protein